MNALVRYTIGLALISTAVGCNTGSAPAPIIVGHVADKTRLDKAGENAELGIRLALHELEKDPKFTEALGARTLRPHHTDARSLDAHESEAVRLVSVNRAVALLGGLSLKESTALDQAQVPLLTFHGHRSAIAGKQVYYLGMSPVAQGDVLARFIAENAKVKRLVLLVDERGGEWGATIDSLQKNLMELRKADEPKLLTLRFGADAKWNDLLDRTRSYEPNAIVFAGSVADFNAWHRVFRQEAFGEPPLLIFAGDDGGHRAFDLDPQGETSVFLATAFMPVASIEKSQTFAKAYHEAFQSEPTVHAALAYDGFRMLADAIKKAHPMISPERVLEGLQQTKEFDGVTGTLWVSADRQVHRPLFMSRWQNGILTHLRTIPAPAKKE